MPTIRRGVRLTRRWWRGLERGSAHAPRGAPAEGDVFLCVTRVGLLIGVEVDACKPRVEVNLIDIGVGIRAASLFGRRTAFGGC